MTPDDNESVVDVILNKKPAHHQTSGYFHIRRTGGLDLISNLEAKFGARSSQIHQIIEQSLVMAQTRAGEILMGSKNFTDLVVGV